APGRLRTTMSALRGALHDAAGAPVLHRLPDPAKPGHAHYWLEPAQLQVDLWQLHDLLDAAASIDLDADPRRRADRALLLRRAAQLPRGELAHGLVADWIHPHREATARHLVDVYRSLADTAPDQHTAITMLQQAIRYGPHTEALYQQLMRCHA